jgi:prepilin-type N-terminal cleavage/methylation domain-containing protein
MERRGVNRHALRRRGYTLLEILVTLTLVMILTLIGVASYRILADNIADRDARGNVDRVVQAERAWAMRNASWTADITGLAVGRGITVTTAISTGPGVVSIAVRGGTELGVAALSETGDCQAKRVGDPLTDAEEEWVPLGDGVPCSGDFVLAQG